MIVERMKVMNQIEENLFIPNHKGISEDAPLG